METEDRDELYEELYRRLRDRLGDERAQAEATRICAQRFMTTSDLALLWGVPRNRAQLWCAKGYLPSRRNGRNRVIRLGDALAFDPQHIPPTKRWHVISPEQVEEIRALYRSGMLQKDIAERFGISISYASLIVRGKRR